MSVRVGIIDSGVAPGAHAALVTARDFSEAERSSSLDLLGHGSAVMAQIAVVQVEICSARVFDRRLSCSPLVVAHAIDWLLEQDVQIINMSFGLRHDRSPLRRACERALAREVCLVSASPAQGEAVYPASYPGVVRATGDARCNPGEISSLATAQADFGGYCGRVGHGPAGASIGCASVTRALAEVALSLPLWQPAQLCDQLRAVAKFQGPEQGLAAVHGVGLQAHE